MPRSKKKKKRIGDYDVAELDSIKKNPKKKKKKKKLFSKEDHLLPVPKDHYFQDSIDKKYEKRRKSKMEQFVESKETYYQDQYEEDDD